MENQQIIEELLLKTAEGDLEAFEQLYQKTIKMVYSYSLSILKNPDCAQDSTQDTYIRIKEASYTYKPLGKPMAWILKIAKNFAYMYIRKASTEQIIDIEENEYIVKEKLDYDIDEAIVLKAALNTLKEDEREIVFLYLVSGMKHKEIAEILKKPLGTVLWKYNLALGKLKKELSH